MKKLLFLFILCNITYLCANDAQTDFDTLFFTILGKKTTFDDFKNKLEAIEKKSYFSDIIKKKSVDGSTLLDQAIKKNKTLEAELLIDHYKANIYTEVPITNETPLIFAIEHCNITIIKKLLEKTNETDDTTKKEAYLNQTTGLNNEDLLTLAIKKDISSCPKKDEKIAKEIVELLLKNGTKITDESDALYFAFLNQYETVVKALLDAAKKNKVDIEKLFNHKNIQYSENIYEVNARRSNPSNALRKQDPDSLLFDARKDKELYLLITGAMKEQKEESEKEQEDEKKSGIILKNFAHALQNISN